MPPIRTACDYPRNESGLVGQFLGTAYDVVKNVYDNLDEIKRLDGVLDEIEDVAENVSREVINELLPEFKQEIQTELDAAVVVINTGKQEITDLTASGQAALNGMVAQAAQSVTDAQTAAENSAASATQAEETVAEMLASVSDLRSELAGPIQETNLIGFRAAGIAAVTRSLGDRFDAEGVSRVKLIDYMTPEMIADVYAGTMLVDCYPACLAASNALGIAGGVIDAIGGNITLMSEWNPGEAVAIEGTGGFYHAGANNAGNTVFVGKHAGRSVISLAGNNGNRLRNLSVKTYPGIYPKTGILLGRIPNPSGPGPLSAGQHHLVNVSVFGHYSQAAIYSIASEVCLWEHTYVWLFGGGAKYCFYTGSEDGLAVGGLAASTNIGCTLIAPHFLSNVDDPDAACMFFKGRYDLGAWRVVAGYFIPYKGSYIDIDLGNYVPGGNIMIGGLDFDVNGEIMAGGDPKCGVRIRTTAGAVNPFPLRGLRINGGRFDMAANSDGAHYSVNIDDNVLLEHPDILVQTPSAFPYATFKVNRKNVIGGRICGGRSARWATVAFSSGWTNAFGGSWATAAYRMESEGIVRCRGSIAGPSLGVMFILPVGFRPPSDQYFTVTAGASGTAVGRVRVSSTTGEVSLVAGTPDHVDLSNICFGMSEF